ncbi:hypothetical protein GCM10027088_68190 [Nocardia goodfellowii]|uniref:Secreted protein n=1 Tax=Nocardia goodfellowii TaxID=882446 RepID=A0ABS4QN44_9NOCA|nr:hypothetical protein [Nocardia goodfellowii]
MSFRRAIATVSVVGACAMLGVGAPTALAETGPGAGGSTTGSASASGLVCMFQWALWWGGSAGHPTPQYPCGPLG